MTIDDLYALLGVAPTATLAEIQAAYPVAAARFHPTRNTHPLASEELHRLNQAYSVLSDPSRRASYDAHLQKNPVVALFACRLLLSRYQVPALAEPQVLYALLEIQPAQLANLTTPPLNLCFVIDCSTSMQEARLDQVKTAVLPVINQLRPDDALAVVAFSDKATVVVPAHKGPDRAVAKAKVATLNAQGGTEILHGLLVGLMEIHQHLKPDQANHLFLLTDGHTYGDESDCLMLAALAASDGITVSGFGIGEKWNDKFLDELTSRTGGRATFIRTPDLVQRYIQERMQGLGDIYAERVTLQVALDPGVKLEQAYRLAPEVGPLSLGPILRLGHLPKQQPLQLLLKFRLPPLAVGEHFLTRLNLAADVISLGRPNEHLTLDLRVQALVDPPASQPPPVIVEALGKLAQAHLQSRAWERAAAGDVAGATQSLKTLSTRLLASGQTELARVAINEAKQLEKTQVISEDVNKQLKYGTRALLEPAPRAR